MLFTDARVASMEAISNIDVQKLLRLQVYIFNSKSLYLYTSLNSVNTFLEKKRTKFVIKLLYSSSMNR